MSLHKSLLAAVTAISVLAGTAAADDAAASRRALHAPTAARYGTHTTADYGHRFGHRIGHRYGRGHAGHRAHRPAVRVVTPHHVPRVHRHTTRCHHEAGHYEFRVREVVIPGHHVERVIPARFEVRWDHHCRSFVSVLVQPRRVVRDWVPRRIEHRREKVWVAARYSCGY